jgi:hypothetical protein
MVTALVKVAAWAFQARSPANGMATVAVRTIASLSIFTPRFGYVFPWNRDDENEG